MKLVHQYVLEAVQRFPEKTAIICGGRKLSYEEFMLRIVGLSTTLVDAGLCKGDRVLILLSDKMEFLVACYAVISQGAIAVPASQELAPSSVEEVVQDCSPLMAITTGSDLVNYPFLHDGLSYEALPVKSGSSTSRNGSSDLLIILCSGKGHRGHDGLKSQDLRGDAGAVIFYTSGTTGKKKGVLLSHRSLVHATLNTNEFMGIDAEIREFVVPALAHSLGFGRSQCLFFVGGTLVVNNGLLNPRTLVRSVHKHRCNAISSVPSGFAMFFGRLEFLLQSIGPQIRFIELGSSPIPLDHRMKLLQIFPNARICMHYGPTEASRSTFIEFRGEPRKLHTAGRPSPNVTLSISDDQGRKLGPMQLGEVLVRGGHVAVGYWQNDELEKQRFTVDGWFKTGDQGFLDEEGYLHLLGRKNEIINMGALEISPLEVEEKIREVYADCELYVLGVSDPAGVVGEIPVLCYVAKEGLTITPSDLSDALSTRLERDYIPRIFYRVESLPKTESEKILRGELREKIIAGSIHEIEQVH